ncbi:hypothetical protein [Microcoleus sp. FACHB-672]|uniref:hypothetical protein n=1 Tax=Microcoleus sp. FACHB-672 TaxID=2692825 RepID=UPI001688555A|nr:hypothetical protein [Microcoleus sp. FACHB-672]MBD2041027.1 hypothetical protein [Microcoleus sp. FACHB-672]
MKLDDRDLFTGEFYLEAKLDVAEAIINGQFKDAFEYTHKVGQYSELASTSFFDSAFVPDMAIEGNEELNLTLENSITGAIIGTQDMAALNVENFEFFNNLINFQPSNQNVKDLETVFLANSLSEWPTAGLGTVQGGETAGELIPNVDRDFRRVGFRVLADSPEAKQTWVIIHGWNNSSLTDSIDSLAKSVAAARPGDRVLALDWREVSYNALREDLGPIGNAYASAAGGNLRAATWIGAVAEFAVKTLEEVWGINSEEALRSLNLIGHSLGSLVSAEIGRIYRDDTNRADTRLNLTNPNAVGVRTITALDPPSEFRGKYDLDSRFAGENRPESFRDVSEFSRAFVGSNSLAGNQDFAVTADESFQIDFGNRAERLTDIGDEHGWVIETFTHLTSEPEKMGSLLGMRAYENIEDLAIKDFGELEIRSREAGRHKGILVVPNPKSNETIDKPDPAQIPELLIARSASNQDNDIVIGSFTNDNINGTDNFNFISGDIRYTGSGDDKFFGESGNDQLNGDSGNDTLSGGSGSDQLVGGGGVFDLGNDLLYGGTGKDELTGGSGRDTFIIERDERKAGNQNEADLITDFKAGTDIIGLIDLSFEQLSFQQFNRGLFGISQDTAVTAGGEFLALLKDVRPDQINNPANFIPADIGIFDIA